MKSYMLLALILVAISLAFTLGTMPSGLLASMPTASDALVPQLTNPPRSVEATTTPEPSRPYELYLPLVLKKAWTVKLMVYPGPSNVDYGPGIELPQGTELTPLGRYVDFVKVQWTDAGVTLQEGFVWVALLANLPTSLPELSKDEVPWIDSPIFVSTHPMEFDNDTNDYHVYKVFGSAIEASEDVRTKASMEVQSSSPDDSSGIGVSNGMWGGTDSRSVGLYYQGGGWNLIYCAGDNYLIYERLPGLDTQEVKLNLMVDKEGQTVKVAKVNSQGGEEIIITRSLSISLYDPTKTVGIVAQAGPTTNLYIDELLISQAPTGKYKGVGAASESLGDLASKTNTIFGAATDPWNNAFDVGETNLLENHARMLAPMGDFYWENIHPEQNRYNFTLADMSLNFAYIHDMDIHIAALFHHLTLADWIEQGNFSREQLIDIHFRKLKLASDTYPAGPSERQLVPVVGRRSATLSGSGRVVATGGSAGKL